MPALKRERHRHEKLIVLLNGTVKARGLTQEEVSRIMGVSKNTAHKFLMDPGAMSVDQLLRAGKGLGIPIDDIRAALA